MNGEQKQKIIETFRLGGKVCERQLFVEAAELTGWLLADAEKQGFTRPQAIEMAKQHLLAMGRAWTEFASDHLERTCTSIPARLSVAPPATKGGTE